MSDEPNAIPALVGNTVRRPPRAAAPQSEPPRMSRRGGGSQVVQETPAEFIDPDTNEPFRRKSQAETNTAWNELMPESKASGWVYQWCPVRVLNEPVDASQARAMHEGGWRPVRPTEMPKEIPPGWDQNTIERHGQILYKRPAYLNEEAREESQRIANKAVIDRFTAAEMTPRGTLPKVSEIKQTIEPLAEDLRYERAAELGELEVQEV